MTFEVSRRHQLGLCYWESHLASINKKTEAAFGSFLMKFSPRPHVRHHELQQNFEAEKQRHW
jgi:hypothetical protein